MEKAFLKNPYCVFYRGFEFWLPDLRRKDHCVVVFRPLCIILIQFGLDPILICDHGLLAIIANNYGWNPAKGLLIVKEN